jgi:hypothetical protein
MTSQPRKLFLPVVIGIGALLCIGSPAFAYVGPGAGLTLLGALWGLIAAVVLSVGFVILWPFRKMLRRSRRAAAEVDSGADPGRPNDPAHG